MMAAPFPLLRLPFHVTPSVYAGVIAWNLLLSNPGMAAAAFFVFERAPNLASQTVAIALVGVTAGCALAAALGMANVVPAFRHTFYRHRTMAAHVREYWWTREPYVLDCWFDSGCAPFAAVHYPFRGQSAPPPSVDFVAEGVDQTRGWFYTLMVLSTALFDQPAFKNLICNGLVLAGDGVLSMLEQERRVPRLTARGAAEVRQQQRRALLLGHRVRLRRQHGDSSRKLVRTEHHP